MLKPLAYMVEGMLERYNMGPFPSLLKAVQACRGRIIGGPDQWTIRFMDADGKMKTVHPSCYSYVVPETEEDAISFIRQREDGVARAQADGTSAALYRLMGYVRCRYDDPHPKQVKDYIATSPSKWKKYKDI